MSDQDTLADGAATGGVDTTKRAGIVNSDSGDKPSNEAGKAARTDTSANSGANSGAGDTSNLAGQNDQPGNSTTVPAGSPGIPRINSPADAPADAPEASSGK